MLIKITKECVCLIKSSNAGVHSKLVCIISNVNRPWVLPTPTIHRHQSRCNHRLSARLLQAIMIPILGEQVNRKNARPPHAGTSNCAELPQPLHDRPPEQSHPAAPATMSLTGRCPMPGVGGGMHPQWDILSLRQPRIESI